MTAVSVLRAFRWGDPWRERIFNHTQERWYRTGYEVVTGNAARGPYVSVSQGMNLARSNAHGDVLVVASADHLPDPEAVEAAVPLAEEFGWAPLFKRTSILTRDATEALLRGEDVDPTRHVEASVAFCTSLMAVRSDVWDDVGGWDERFYGWGCEDTAFRLALSTLYGEPPTLPDHGTFALWHRKAPRDRFDVNVALLDGYYAAAGLPSQMRTLLAER